MSRVSILAVLCLAVAGCGAHVKPYERGALTHPSMDSEWEAEQDKFEAHFRESREGSTYGSSAAGGGCGCN